MRDRLKAVAEAVSVACVTAALALSPLALWTPVSVGGGSMAPTLAAGDLALVRRDARPHPGDVVLFASAGHGRVLHRVTRVLGDGSVVTRGDSNPIEDFRATPSSAVLGVVVAVVPVGKWIAGARAQVARRWRALRRG